MNDGSVYGWGDGIDGELANESVVNWYLPNPTLIAGLGNAFAISAGELTACAIVGQGEAQCWGRTGDPVAAAGEPGTALMSSDGVVRVVPTAVPNLGVVWQVSTGVRAAVAAANIGGVYGWGDSRWGLLEFPQGNPASWFSSRRVGSPPYDFSGDVVGLTLGDNHGCALVGSGKVQCWGDNESGQLGLGRATPTWPQAIHDVLALENIVHVDAGGDATCALNRGGHVYCWGANRFDQLGQSNGGDVTAIQATPSLVQW